MNGKWTRIGLVLVGAGILLAGAAASAGPDGVPAYSLKKLSPKGFGVFKGVLDWVPVSKTSAVAFAGNQVKGTDNNSLVSFKMSNSGVPSDAQTIATGKGKPWEAACVWLESGANGAGAGTPFGYVFVLFEVYVSKPESETASVWMAKFDSRGKVVGDWKELLKVKTPAGRSINDEHLFAHSRGSSVAVVASLSHDNRQGQRKALVYFLEIGGQQGALVGKPVLLPLPQNGDYLEATGYAPAWNGLCWLVPVAATLRKSPGVWEDITGKKALVCTVGADTAHKAVAHDIASDMTTGWGPYGDMWLTPYPNSASDHLLFLKKQKEVPEAQRKQDLFSYSFSLNKIDGTGNLLKTQKIAVPALTHKLAYDPDATIEYPDDYWTPLTAKDGTLFISRAHTINDWKRSGSGRRDGSTDRYEQQYCFYTLNALTGAVALKAQSFTLENEAMVLQPVIKAFSSSSLAVVNTIWFYYGDYPRWSYFSKFAY
jgi:hypothetical protein